MIQNLQSPIDTSAVGTTDYERVVAKVKLGKRFLTVASVYIRSGSDTQCTGLLEQLRALLRGDLVVRGDSTLITKAGTPPTVANAVEQSVPR